MRCLVVVTVCLAGLTAHHPSESADGAAERWSFLVGNWRVVERRFGFDAKLIQTHPGRSTFAHVFGGRRLQERLVLFADPDTSLALHLFAFGAGDSTLEIARMDSHHDGFFVITGAVSVDRMDLLEKQPDPQSEVSRRITYLRADENHFVRRLEFSQDHGASWFVRSEWSYTRE